MSNFITNHGSKKLENRINDLISVADELKFLVGFFYFSGLRTLFEAMKKNEKVEIAFSLGNLLNFA